MAKIGVVIFCALGFIATSGRAELVTESWMRQAGISCGGGLSMELQGELDIAVLKRLKMGNVSGNGSYQISQAETLLKQFQQEEKRQVYRDYANCLLTLMNMASNTSQLPPRDVLLTGPIAAAPLGIVKRGQRFVMAPTDSVAIKDLAIILSVNSITEGAGNSGDIVTVTWSNSETGKSGRGTPRGQSQVILLGENCTLIPYKIDAKGKQASFLSNC
jgi:hypothetical protein